MRQSGASSAERDILDGTMSVAMPALEQASAAWVLLAAAGATGVAFLLGAGLTALVRKIADGRDLVVERHPVWHAPLTVLLVIVAVRAVSSQAGHRGWITPVANALTWGTIAAVAWLLLVVCLAGQRALLTRYAAAGNDERHARTKITLVNRVTQAAIITLAVAATLWTIPEVKAVGVGILASAPVIGAVVGLDAHTTLGNVFAGMQIAFTDALRIGDNVDIDERWGQVADITLPHVVVRVWDGTALILPCTYLTTTPFRNWTPQAGEVTGRVGLTVDWSAPLPACAKNRPASWPPPAHWDGRQGDLFVDQATTGGLTLIAIVSARNGDALAALR